MNTLFIISAPSGAGKTSLLKALLEEETHLQASISYTTRPKRVDEKKDVHYHFVSDSAFKDMIQKQDFLEYARVFEHYYGTSKQQVEDILKQGKDVILEIDWQGARQVRALFKETVGIFIVPPSLASLQERLEGRGQDKPATIQRRLSEAKQELSHYKEYDYLVVNDHFDSALKSLRSIIEASSLSMAVQKVRQGSLLRHLGLV
ncbi:MAG: guanylate kinase [Gammaproteobacteria bacterium]|nr:guanylate kinase [Gammaproteobacteria bacterium]